MAQETMVELAARIFAGDHGAWPALAQMLKGAGMTICAQHAENSSRHTDKGCTGVSAATSNSSHAKCALIGKLLRQPYWIRPDAGWDTEEREIVAYLKGAGNAECVSLLQKLCKEVMEI